MGVAHDFNNLLTVIMSCAESLKEDAGQGRPTDVDVVEEIAYAADRARNLTRQLLAFARKQAISPISMTSTRPCAPARSSSGASWASTSR